MIMAGSKPQKGQVYHIHPFDPKNKSVIHRIWEEIRWTKCPIVGSKVQEKPYMGKFVEYTYINKKGKPVYVDEYLLLVKWINAAEVLDEQSPYPTAV